MDSPSKFESLAIRFAPYLGDLHDFFVTCGMPFGSPEDLRPFAAALGESAGFRSDVSSIVRSIIYRENKSIPIVDLLELLVLAVGGPHVDETTEAVHEPVRQTLNFVREVYRSLHGRPLPAAPAPALEELVEVALPENVPHTAVSGEVGAAKFSSEDFGIAHLSGEQLSGEPVSEEAPVGSETFVPVERASERDPVFSEMVHTGSSGTSGLEAEPAIAFSEADSRLSDNAAAVTEEIDPVTLSSGVGSTAWHEDLSPLGRRDAYPEFPVAPAAADRVEEGTSTAPLPRWLWVAVPCLAGVAAFGSVSLLHRHPREAVAEQARPAQDQAPEAPALSTASQPVVSSGEAAPAQDSLRPPATGVDSPYAVADARALPAPDPGTLADGTDSQLDKGRPAHSGRAASAGTVHHSSSNAVGENVSASPSSRPRTITAGAQPAFAAPEPLPKAIYPATAEPPAASSPRSSRPERPARSAPNLRPGMFSVSSGIMAGNLLSAPPPEYPTLARITRVEGEVVLQAFVARDGSVMATHVLRGHRLLRGAAEHAVRRWRYQPYSVEGRAVDVATIVTVDFRLHH